MENLKNNVSVVKLIFQNTKDRNLRLLFCTDILSENNVFWWKNNFPRDSDINLPDHL